MDTPSLAVASKGSGRLSLIGVFSLLAVWFVILAGLTLFTANPTTVNLRQVRGSQAILEVRVVNPALGQVEVLRQLAGEPVASDVTISNLYKTPARPQQEYLVPVRYSAEGRLEVTTLPATKEFPVEIEPFIYPVTEDIRTQVIQALQVTTRPQPVEE